MITIARLTALTFSKPAWTVSDCDGRAAWTSASTSGIEWEPAMLTWNEFLYQKGITEDDLSAAQHAYWHDLWEKEYGEKAKAPEVKAPEPVNKHFTDDAGDTP